MNYNATDDDKPADDTPICPTMDQMQDFYNQDHSYGDKQADEEDDDDEPWD